MAVADRSAKSIDTRKVVGRRQIRYQSIDDLLADAEQLAAGPHRTLGNWSLGMILKHLASAFNMGLDGSPTSAPRPLQMLIRAVMQKRFFEGPMKPGFKLPKKASAKYMPTATSTEEGLGLLREAIGRWKSASHRYPHPLLGPLTPAEWDLCELRHAELHMSFVVPE